jgi:hypothetical protein
LEAKTSDAARILSDVRAYVRISAAQSLRPVAKTVIDTWEKAEVYSKLDGKTPQSKISEVSKVAQQTISDWMSLFVQSGLVTEPNEFYSSHRALFSLRELGINQGALKRKKPGSAGQQELVGQETAQRQAAPDRNEGAT